MLYEYNAQSAKAGKGTIGESDKSCPECHGKGYVWKKP